jgi:hypothetical protein
VRISLRYDEQPHGVLFRRTMSYAVYTIDFSDEEKEIIRHRNLEEFQITGFSIELLMRPNLSAERWWHKLPKVGPFIPMRVGDVTIREVLIYRTFIYRSRAASQLNELEASIRSALENAKHFIEENKNVRRSKAFEL